jgi:hypothetical protein
VEETLNKKTKAAAGRLSFPVNPNRAAGVGGLWVVSAGAYGEKIVRAGLCKIFEDERIFPGFEKVLSSHRLSAPSGAEARIFARPGGTTESRALPKTIHETASRC